MPGIRSILSLLQSMAGLATGAVLSLVYAILLLASDMIELDHTVLALTWVMVSFVFAIGFYTAKAQMKDEKVKLDVPEDLPG